MLLTSAFGFKRKFSFFKKEKKPHLKNIYMLCWEIFIPKTSLHATYLGIHMQDLFLYKMTNTAQRSSQSSKSRKIKQKLLGNEVQIRKSQTQKKLFFLQKVALIDSLHKEMQASSYRSNHLQMMIGLRTHLQCLLKLFSPNWQNHNFLMTLTTQS